MINYLRNLGRVAIDLAEYFGSLALLAAEVLASLGAVKARFRLLLEQLVEVGLRSQAVVSITGAFTGAVFAAQTYFQFHKVSMESAVGAVVSVAMCRELGPVLAGLMVAGRVGAAMSAQLGTMKVTEQIDALRAMGVHPTEYLVVPRAVAMMIAMPLLVAECIALGILAGYFAAVKMLGVDAAYYIVNMLKFTTWSDIVMGLTKAVVFGVTIVIVSCHQGLNTDQGAVGVGRATTKAVVISSLMILISNFFLTMALNIVFPAG
jgi:phospholipid/cholesterol/gamma-HCH transport system permease protein